MALFKIYKGLSDNLKNTPNPQKEDFTKKTKEGHCYFTTDDGKFYIDIIDDVAPVYPDGTYGGGLSGVTRMPINSYKSDWSARAFADAIGKRIDTWYGHKLQLTDTYNLSLVAGDETTVLNSITLPKNVETAEKFTSNQTIKLTGAVTGENSSQAGWAIATTLTDNIVTTAKIANNAVTNAKIANGAVTNGKIANSTISNAKLVNSSININGASVSLGGSLTLADIGLSSALRFIGQTTTAIVDGGTTSPVSVNGSNVTPTIGDVVINSNNNQEYVWLGSNWELLGDESSYALKDHTHKYAGSSSVGGAANSANKLNTNAGSTTQPVYFESGIPKACVDKFVFYESVGDSPDINTSTLFVEKKGDVMTGNLTAPKFIGALQGNADTATALTSSAGSATQPIYFENGKPKNTTYTLAKSVPSDAKFTDTVYTHPTTSGNKHIPSGGSSGQILRWSADGTAAWGNDNNTTYESMSVAEGTTGTETTSRVLTAANLKGIINAHAPTKTGGGASGTWGINITGNAATATKLAAAKTIQTNLASTSTASFDGSANVTPGVTGILGTANGGTGLSALVTPTVTWTAGTTAGPKIAIKDSLGKSATAVAIPSASSSASGIVTTGTQSFKGVKTFDSETYMSSFLGIQHKNVTKGTLPSSIQYWTLNNCDVNGSAYQNALGQFETALDTAGLTKTYIRARQFVANNASSIATATLSVQVDINGNQRADCSAPLYGAVWNDYAEFRTQKETIEPGYCVASANNGQVYKTTEKFQACDGIVSDTFGFSIGETDECKTPLAVAGRVLAYFHGEREDYNAGDTVCAGPEGKVMKMTREEVREWPDRIVGIVSEIPEYETWGSGNVQVNNRIWIKVK